MEISALKKRSSRWENRIPFHRSLPDERETEDTMMYGPLSAFFLVTEHVKIPKEIFKKECDPGLNQRPTLKRLYSVCSFLKYRNHLKYSEEDGYHDLQHALLKGRSGSGGGSVTKMSTCHLCLCIPHVVKDIGDAVVTNNSSIKVALKQFSQSFELYVGHCCRSKVQQDGITAEMQDMHI